MSPDTLKIFGALAVMAIITFRCLSRLRGLEGDARAREIRRFMTGGLLTIAALAIFVVYVYLTGH